MLPIQSSLASTQSFSWALRIPEKLVQAVNTAVRLIFHNSLSGYAKLIGAAGALVISFKCTKWIAEQYKIAEGIRHEAIDRPVLEDLKRHKFEKHLDDAKKFAELADAAINRKAGVIHSVLIQDYREDLRQFIKFSMDVLSLNSIE